MARTNQLNILAELDRAKTHRYHLAAAAIAGTGFFAGAYNLYSASLIYRLLGRVYFADSARPGEPGTLPPDAAAALSGAVNCGTFVGQLAFGWLGDRIGRRRAYGFALALVAVCSAASGLSFGRTAKAVVATLCFFRFWLGVGAGGGYPLSAAIMAEYANRRKRGAFLAAMYAMQGMSTVTRNAERGRVPRSRNFRSGTRNGDGAVRSQERGWVAFPVCALCCRRCCLRFHRAALPSDADVRPAGRSWSGLDLLERASEMGGSNNGTGTTPLGEPLLEKKARAYRPRCPGCRIDRLNAIEEEEG